MAGRAAKFDGGRVKTLLNMTQEEADAMDTACGLVFKAGSRGAEVPWTRQELIRQAVRELTHKIARGTWRPSHNDRPAYEAEVVRVVRPTKAVTKAATASS